MKDLTGQKEEVEVILDGKGKDYDDTKLKTGAKVKESEERKKIVLEDDTKQEPKVSKKEEEVLPKFYDATKDVEPEPKPKPKEAESFFTTKTPRNNEKLNIIRSRENKSTDLSKTVKVGPKEYPEMVIQNIANAIS